MKVEEKRYSIDKVALFEAAKKCLLAMKGEIKLDRKDVGILVAFVESLTSYPSGELILIEISSHDVHTSVLHISSESMAVNSRLFKKVKDSGNISKFFKLIDKSFV